MGSGNIRICTVVNIKHGCLGTLKEDFPVSLDFVMEQCDGIAYIRAQAVCIALILLQHGLIIHRLLAVQLHNLLILQLQVFLQPLGKFFLVNEIADTDADAVVTVGIARADAVLGRTYLVVTLQLLDVAVHLAVVRQNHMGAVADADAADIDALLNHAVHFLQHNLRVKGNTIAHHAQSTLVKNAGRHQAQLVLRAINGNSMAGIAAALIADNSLSLLCQIIYDFTLTFVTPLGAQNYNS